jgi:hypothetical protein
MLGVEKRKSGNHRRHEGTRGKGTTRLSDKWPDICFRIRSVAKTPDPDSYTELFLKLLILYWRSQ